MELKDIRIIPVASTSEIEWLYGKILQELRVAIAPLNALGKSYDHDVPWGKFCLNDPKAYLHRVQIGAVGRINTVEDAVYLGIVTKVLALSNHFTSTGLYYLFRYARQQKRQMIYLKQFEKWTRTYGRNKDNPLMFLNYRPKK